MDRMVKIRILWVVVIASCILLNHVTDAQKGKKNTKTSKKNSFPPIVRNKEPTTHPPPPPTEPPPMPPNEWEVINSKPRPPPNRYSDKMQNEPPIGQVAQENEDIQQIPQQNEDIQQIPQQNEDIQQIPQQNEDIQQIPQKNEDIQQIPQQNEDIPQIPQQNEDIYQIPQQNEDIYQIPQQNEDIYQIPQQNEDIQQIPQQNEEVGYIPGRQPSTKSEKMTNSFQDLPAPMLTSNDIIGGPRSSGVCAAFGPHHYRTFGGRHYNYGGICTYVLTQDCTPVSKKSQPLKWNEKFAVLLEHNIKCHESNKFPGHHGTPRHSCTRPYTAVHLQLNENRYVIRFPGEEQAGIKGDENFLNQTPGFSIFEGERELALPFVNENVKIFPSQRYLVVKTAKDLIIRLDYEGTAVTVQLPEKYTGKTCGLCGHRDSQTPSEDFVSPDGSAILNPRAFGNSWAEVGPDDTCSDVAREAPDCSLETKKGRKTTESSSQRCLPILAAEFATCHDELDPSVYYEACQQDCCHTNNEENCECSSLAEYFRECLRMGGKLPRGWRTNALCPLNCKNQTVYSECVSPCSPTCQNPNPSCDSHVCVDGCHCPPGTVSLHGQCVPQDNCPCELRGKQYLKGQTVRQDCNTCECQGGQWTCTTDVCPARCVISGQHHLTTFDGRTYVMPKDCSFALYYSEKYVIEIENVPCRGGSSSIKNGKTNYGKSEPSTVCSRNLVIVENNADKSIYIKLKRFLEVTVDGEEINYLPVRVGDVLIKQISSFYLQVELPNGIKVVWNGESGGYVQVPASFYDKTDGLCGTFNRNQADDFFTPEGDNELTVAAFARKWRTRENCDISTEMEDAPCDKNPYQRLTAERMCESIKSNAFMECHQVLDPEPFYRACVYEICDCDGRLEACLCPLLEQYSMACASSGFLVNWRPEIPECGIHCGGGQQYQMCVKSCDYSCAALSMQQNCSDRDCVDGCACPPGSSLDSLGRCVPKSQCPCVRDGKEYPYGFQQQRSGKICECTNGRFECRFDSGVTESPDPLLSCSDNQENVDCLTECPLTCENMNHQPKCHTKTCRPGCRCRKGYVLDSALGKCVRPEQCPCHHGGKSYRDGSQIRMDCNNCLCKGSHWVCEQSECPGQCSVYGSSHYQTFDGKMYDVEGNCQYVLTQGVTNDHESFSVIVQNVPCGASKLICSKEITFNIGFETVTLPKEGPFPSSRRFQIKEVGLFVYLTSEAGIEILWDKKSRLYVRADSKHKRTLKGLCGDFDGDSTNDFKLPSGGLPETRATIFADSWKLHDYCPVSQEVTDICTDETSHRQWAVHQCHVLKSEVFSSCHELVPVQIYYERCITDTCTCESGGSCDCLCTAIVVYADVCASRGVPITWRSQDLCPIQCEECDHYNPCIPLCPRDTCLSIKTEGVSSCRNSPCVEGCDIKPCPAGQVYNTSSHSDCVPEAQCEAPNNDCLVDGKVYKDGDWIEQITLDDPCQSCYCKKGKVECTEHECSRMLKPATKSTTESEQMIHFPMCTIYGWTEWMNSYHPDDKSNGDQEDILDYQGHLYKTYDIPCPHQNMTLIECRPVKSTKNVKGGYSEDVDCSLPKGLVCINGQGKGGRKCQDYEIRVFCSCENEKFIEITTTTTPEPTTTTLEPTTTTPEPTTTTALETTTFVYVTESERELPRDCLPENHGWSEWVSATNGRTDKKGDRESVELASRLTQACPPEHVRNIQCRVAGSDEAWYDAGQRGVTCDMTNGLICLHGKQPKGKKCNDYEVRVFCFCMDITTTTLATTTESPCPPGLRWSPCLFRCDQTCHSYHDKLVMSGSCNLDQQLDKCVPGCEYVECNKPGYFQIDERTCVKGAECTCVLPDGSILAPGTIIQKDCKKCHCVGNRLKCVNVERCGWTTAHAQMIATTCPPPTTPLCDEGYKIVEDGDPVCPGFKCIPECPPGLVWYDCHPRCELSCANKKRNCAEGCVSGCFCPTGKIRHGDKCLEPNECPDRVCHGFGDPQVVTFDGAMFNFQGKGTFIMANHVESSLIISGHTDYCQGRVACIVGMLVEYQGHKVDIRRNENVQLDNYALNLERLPVEVAGITILGYPGHNYMVVIPELNAQIYYFSSHAAFSIKVPVALFFNRTKGLCGNCNFADDDDEMDVDHDGIPDNHDVLCKFMSEGSYDSCIFDNEQQVPINFDDNPFDCIEFQHPILQECIALVDPEPYRRACLYDVVKGSHPKEASCKALLEFTRECCEANAPVLKWLEIMGCEVPCPEGSQFIQCHDACPQTCTNASTETGYKYERLVNGGPSQNIKGSTKGGKTEPMIEGKVKCHEMKMDGCFCPDGMVFHRGKCMSNSVCDTCDDEGHKPGDSWKEGKCTECLCDYNLKVVCLTPTCPSPPICRMEETMRVLPNGTETCCTVYKCELKPKPTCPPAVVPTCAPGEIAKLKDGIDNCPEYICECDPGLCPMVKWPVDLEPGQQVELISVQCCSKAEIVCHPESCPVAPSCAPGLELKTLPGECCDSYKCKPPEDVCVFSHQLRIVDGAEYPIVETEQVPTVYKPNEKWNDGLCRNCTCEGADGNYSPRCTLEKCPSINDMPDKKDYVLSTIPIPNQCCPIIARLYCKDNDGNIHEVGEEWKNPNDNCLSYRCEISNFGDVQKVERAIVCTECPESTEYVTPPSSLGLCCGWCRPIICEEGGEIYPVGSIWNSTIHKCYSAECIMDGGSVRTIYTSPKCAAVPEECPPEHIVWDETGCCQMCNITLSKCVPAFVNETESIGFLTIRDSRLGVCQNYKKVPGLKECSGTCDSHSKYSMDQGVFQSNCHCCSPVEFEVIEVELECAKGRIIKRKFQQPTACSCNPCVGEGRNEKQTGGTKTKSKTTKGGRFEQQNSDFIYPQHNFGQFGQEPIGQEQIGQEQIGQEQIGQEQIGQEQIGQEQIGQEQIGQEQIGQEQIGQEQIGQEQIGQNQIQPESGRVVYPDSSETGQSRIAYDQNERYGQEPIIYPESSSRHQTGQTQSNFAFGQNQGVFGQQPDERYSHQNGHSQSNFDYEQHQGGFGQKPIRQNPYEIGPHPSEFGQHPSEIGQHPSEIGQHPSEIGQHPSEIGQHPSEIGQHPSEIGQHPSEIGHSPFGGDSHTEHHSTYEKLPNGYEKTYTQTSRNSYNQGTHYNSNSQSGHQGASGDPNSEWSRQLAEHQRQVEEMMKLQNNYHDLAQAQHAQQLNDHREQRQG